ncbi:MAG: hypothetical protein HYU64_05410 [Armatimonadetes bacterium]|nr:hypothetical protein [Armatimonadota bacterium]
MMQTIQPYGATASLPSLQAFKGKPTIQEAVEEGSMQDLYCLKTRCQVALGAGIATAAAVTALAAYEGAKLGGALGGVALGAVGFLTGLVLGGFVMETAAGSRHQLCPFALRMP